MSDGKYSAEEVDFVFNLVVDAENGTLSDQDRRLVERLAAAIGVSTAELVDGWIWRARETIALLRGIRPEEVVLARGASNQLGFRKVIVDPDNPFSSQLNEDPASGR